MTTTAHGSSRLTDTPAPATSAATLLRRFLALDAVVTTGNGIIYLAFSSWVATLFDVSATPLVYIGIFLTAFGLFVGSLALSSKPSTVGTTIVADANIIWAVGSVVVAAIGLMGANTWGTLWTIAQAVVVGAFAGLQLYGLKKLKAAQ